MPFVFSITTSEAFAGTETVEQIGYAVPPDGALP
jgi:hypothetical protein